MYSSPLFKSQNLKIRLRGIHPRVPTVSNFELRASAIDLTVFINIEK